MCACAYVCVCFHDAGIFCVEIHIFTLAFAFRTIFYNIQAMFCVLRLFSRIFHYLFFPLSYNTLTSLSRSEDLTVILFLCAVGLLC